MINRERLANTFKWLVGIDSVSREESEISQAIQSVLAGMGAKIRVDDAASRIGGNAGNVVARFDGNSAVPPLMLNAHMDTVEPGRGVRAIFEDGVFRSDGSTILGADDKSAIAVIIETMRIIQERGIPCGPVEVVLTVCEEIGLMGAKHLDFSLISARYGYALDASNTEGIVTRAPAANRFEIRVHGKAAHAGAAPEDGVNAILLASRAVAALTLGRIDAETTCNIGTIEGGTATNIVPDRVTLQGEVRSHDTGKLNRVTDTILSTFDQVIAAAASPDGGASPAVDWDIHPDFPATHIDADHPVVTLAQRAAANLGRTITPQSTGGGADANIFFDKGIVTGVLGTGMKNMHTVRESIALDDMVRMTELMLEILRLHTEDHLDRASGE
ncbi:M20/M25/M40 family metallo-hydrolase [Desulfococcus multivorans]|uniref:Peptidase T-like protein n=1 Tax=Desulfococcus multivorans DSM 2059 TaxID=1121405 RepID=S7TPE3_DESML|nr:M20/M25/M40 family metallo-hydrolase [Desulfococcus multivorans]AOY58991.1 PepT: tripeptide aminopeptidase (peptidase T) [Desulfococcus multivorans]AQV01255.1 peptidase T [Desulfococcus multivorans]EPR39102.1 peptidase T-like protein [Desulfococcus multivorans DSM 2059]SJZ54952.1 peptidase T-like protein [Desulfococcus multivorans DSM 2059]